MAAAGKGTVKIYARWRAQNGLPASEWAMVEITLVKRPLTITADGPKTKVYGTSDPEFTYTAVSFNNHPGLWEGDTFNRNYLIRADGENVATYNILDEGLTISNNYFSNSPSSDNYAVTYIGNVLTITPAGGSTITITPGTYTYNSQSQGPGDEQARTTGSNGKRTYSYTGKDKQGNTYGPSEIPPIVPGEYEVTDHRLPIERKAEA